MWHNDLAKEVAMENGINYKKADVPPCCGNCDLNDWDEDGPLCMSDGNGGKFDMFATVCPDGFDEDDARVSWDSVCDYYVKETERAAQYHLSSMEDKQER
jgi:hypothetical protein